MELLVNGRQFRVDTDPERSLLFVLRDDLDLTGAKLDKANLARAAHAEAPCERRRLKIDTSPSGFASATNMIKLP